MVKDSSTWVFCTMRVTWENENPGFILKMGNTETSLAAGNLENRWKKILPWDCLNPALGKCLNKDFGGLHLDFKITICYLKKVLCYII